MAAVALGCCCEDINDPDKCRVCAYATCGGAPVLVTSITLYQGANAVASGPGPVICGQVNRPGGAGEVRVDGGPDWTSANQNVEWVCDETVYIAVYPKSVRLRLQCAWEPRSICGVPITPPTATYKIFIGGVEYAGGTITEGEVLDLVFPWPEGVEPPASVRVEFTQPDPCWDLERIVEGTVDCVQSLTFQTYSTTFQVNPLCAGACLWPWNPPTECYYQDAQVSLILSSGPAPEPDPGDVRPPIPALSHTWCGTARVYCEWVTRVLWDPILGRYGFCAAPGGEYDVFVCVWCLPGPTPGTVSFAGYKMAAAYSGDVYCESEIREPSPPYMLNAGEPVGSVPGHASYGVDLVTVFEDVLTEDCLPTPTSLHLAGSMTWFYPATPPGSVLSCFNAGPFTVDFNWEGSGGPGGMAPAAPMMLAAPIPGAIEPPLPSLFRQIGGFLTTATSVVVGAAKGEEVRASERLATARRAACQTGLGLPPNQIVDGHCGHYRPSDGRCGQMTGCGCYTAQKATFARGQCPMGWWPRTEADLDPSPDSHLNG